MDPLFSKQSNILTAASMAVDSIFLSMILLTTFYFNMVDNYFGVDGIEATNVVYDTDEGRFHHC